MPFEIVAMRRQSNWRQRLHESTLVGQLSAVRHSIARRIRFDFVTRSVVHQGYVLAARINRSKTITVRTVQSVVLRLSSNDSWLVLPDTQYSSGVFRCLAAQCKKTT